MSDYLSYAQCQAVVEYMPNLFLEPSTAKMPILLRLCGVHRDVENGKSDADGVADLEAAACLAKLGDGLSETRLEHPVSPALSPVASRLNLSSM